DNATANDLREIGLAYHSYVAEVKKPPSDPLDIAVKLTPPTSRKLGEAKYIVIPGIQPAEYPADARGNTILAYQRDVPSMGGWILMVDGTVRKVSTEEFKKLPQAGKGTK